jgi:hypothetical protein
MWCFWCHNTYTSVGPSSWSSGKRFWLLIMRPRVRFPVLPWGFFHEGENPHGDHGLGSLVELRFKAPPGTSYSYITIHLTRTTLLRLMGVTTSEVGYISATVGRGDHEVHMVALKNLWCVLLLWLSRGDCVCADLLGYVGTRVQTKKTLMCLCAVYVYSTRTLAYLSKIYGTKFFFYSSLTAIPEWSSLLLNMVDKKETLSLSWYCS